MKLVEFVNSAILLNYNFAKYYFFLMEFLVYHKRNELDGHSQLETVSVTSRYLEFLEFLKFLSRKK